MRHPILTPLVIGFSVLAIPITWVTIGKWLFPDPGIGEAAYFFGPPAAVLCWIFGKLVIDARELWRD